jgi:hypothetical protein
MTRAGLALAAVVSVAVATRTARGAGPEMKQCIAAFDDGQRSRSDKKLRRAQTELLVCTQESCPAVLRADCAGVLRTVQAALPTIVLAAQGPDGQDITDVKVSVGASAVAERLDGRAIEFDPGTYDFRFERPNAPPITVHQVLREGEKNRVVRGSFLPKDRSAGAAAAESPPPRPLVGYVVPAGFAVLGIAAFTVAGVSRLGFDSEVEDMRSRCAPECSAEERADLSSRLVTSNVALGVGIGAIALAAASWFFLQPRAARRASQVGMVTRFAW